VRPTGPARIERAKQKIREILPWCERLVHPGSFEKGLAIGKISGEGREKCLTFARRAGRRRGKA
jgi:hypothetical protein